MVVAVPSKSPDHNDRNAPNDLIRRNLRKDCSGGPPMPMGAAMNAAAVSLAPSPDGALGPSGSIRPIQRGGGVVRPIEAQAGGPAVQLTNVTQRVVRPPGA